MEKLTEWLKAERGRLSRLAEAIGVTASAIAQWERVPGNRLGQVSRATGLTPQELRPDIFAEAERAA